MRARRTFGNSPKVFTALDSTTIGSLDVLSATNDREGNSIRKDTSVLCARLIVVVNGRLIDTDALHLNNFTDLIIRPHSSVRAFPQPQLK